MKPHFFKTPLAFRNWLIKNHSSKSEIFVGYYKIKSGKPSMNWSDSVDEALCFGWIDGIKYTIDAESYCIRFTPRRKNSIWSAVNIKKVQTLIENGKMQPAGLEIYNHRKEEKSKVYSFENKEAELPNHFIALFKKNKPAWLYFQNLAPSYRKTTLHYIMSAKLETTRVKRLEEMIRDSAAGINKWKNNPYQKKQ